MKKNKEITCIDLFCGAGGLTYGMIQGGINVLAGVDTDPACQYPYEANNNGAVFLKKDVSQIKSNEIKGIFKPGTIKLIAGCAPCQPFSTYSQRYDNERDGKWALLYEFDRIVRDVRPEIVTMENVPSILKHQVFIDFVNTLKRRKYHVWYEVVDCSHYGVPQSRMRTVLLASKYGPINLIQKTHSKPMTVRQAIGKLRPLKAGECAPRDKMHIAANLSTKNLKRIQVSKPGGTWRDWPKHLIADCHKRDEGKSFPSVYGRMNWNNVAPTMTTQCYGYGNGRFGHPEQDRAISLREAAILQGFPRNYKFVPSDGKVEFKKLGRLIGNAVPVDLGRVIAESIVSHVQECAA
jgi:DNA (cytosine-5)-methyltransferase 1